MASALTPKQPIVLTRIIAMLLSVVVFIGINWRIGDASIRYDKDNVYLFLCGTEYAGQSSHEQQDKLVEHLVAVSAHEHLIYRAKMRGAYCNNYLFTSLSMYLTGKVQRLLGITDPARDFPEFLISAMRWGMLLSGATLGGLCLLVVFWAARGPLVMPLFGAIALAALFYLTVPIPALSWSLHQMAPAPPAPIVSLYRVLGLSLHAWINPTAAFSPFSIYPRCLCAMLAFAAFVLRWSGRSGPAYWAPIAVSFVHQSEAPIVLGVMIVCDLVRQPKELLRPACLVPIAVALVLTALRERMFSIMGLSSAPITIGLAVATGLVIVVFILPKVRSVATVGWSIVDRWRVRWFEGLSLPVADAIVIALGSLALVILCYVASRGDLLYRVIYLWSELFPRYIGLFQLPVFAGLIYAGYRWLLARRLSIEREALAALSCLMLVIAITEWKGPWTPTAAIAAQGQVFEKVLQQHYVRDDGSFGRVESPWYYLMLRRAYLGGKGLDEYFSKS